MKNNFIKRAATSAVFVIVLVGGSLWHQASFFVLFSTIVILGLIELYRITGNQLHKPQKISGIAFGLSIFVSFFLVASSIFGKEILLMHIPLVIIILVIEIYRKKEDPFANIAITLLGSLYIAVPFGLLSFLVFNPRMGSDYNPLLLITYFSLIWINDSGAYIVGSAIGKHRLFKRISPKKSWEGFIGGALCTILAAYIASTFIKQIDLVDWIAISVITFSFGTLGDLFESLLKRSVNIKDSGSLLPGHGGILDRFDSLILSSPMVFVYITIFS